MMMMTTGEEQEKKGEEEVGREGEPLRGRPEREKEQIKTIKRQTGKVEIEILS